MIKTKLLKEHDIEEAADLLKKGEVVAFPTETVYGLGAPIFNPKAIKKLYEIKNRPEENPLIAHISNLNQLERIVIDVPEECLKLAELFFPGPLTIILPKAPNVPLEATGGLETIGVRMPAHPVARALIDAVGEPLVAPSANLSGSPSATLAQHVLDDFSGKIAAVLDGGPSQYGIESTVILFNKNEGITILRPGEITKEQLERAIKQKVVLVTDTLRSPQSPGMKFRHYAPKALLKLFENWEKLLVYIQTSPHRKKMLLTSEQVPFRVKEVDHFLLAQEELFKLFRMADKMGYDEIIVYCDREIIKNDALYNRLTKAADTPK